MTRDKKPSSSRVGVGVTFDTGEWSLYAYPSSAKKYQNFELPKVIL